jgi:3-hydroxyacyl-[acyl-carrier protein] dehydratase/trans-2-decenoyl-[acyl-carrier protein] isomerase
MTDATPFVPQSHYDKAELIACGMGELFGAGNAQLPVENMLMVDRISHISSEGGATGKGELIAELDIHPDLWFFACHFPRRSGHARLSGPGRHVATRGLFSGLAG